MKKSSATRAAERFFKERRATIQFIDLKQKPMARGEINRFVQRFGMAGLLDTESKAYVDGGLKYLRVSDDEMLARIEKNPELLRLPLVRGGSGISIGQDPEAWKAMITG
ncbi:MAG TPA: ArsC/Spx/MgsR family protein [Bryobacteraceae bacterium]